jgi:hypothetical protein
MADLIFLSIITGSSASSNVTAVAVIAGLIYINNLLLEVPDFFLDIYATKLNEYPVQPTIMYQNKHLIYWINRYPKSMDLTLEDLLEALQYKRPGMTLECARFRGGFEIFIPMEGITYINEDGMERQHYYIINVDSIKSAIRIYIYKEEYLAIDFAQIRENFCDLINAVKEYMKEHRTVDKMLSKIIS